MARRKKIIPKQLRCRTLEVQYAEATIEERSRPEKEYEDTIFTYIEKCYAKKLSREGA